MADESVAAGAGDADVAAAADAWRPGIRDLVAVAIAVALFAGGWGYWLGSRRHPDVPSASSADVGFLRDMLAHHEQALTLSNLLLTSEGSPGVAHHAREILIFQANEIGSMTRMLAMWGHGRGDPSGPAMAWMGAPVAIDDMPGLAADEEVDALRRATGAHADALFVRLMQDHHLAGVHMAEAAVAAASAPAVRALAASMARNQAIEVNEMEQTRLRLGLDPAPAGYEADPPPAAAGAGHGH